MFLRLLFFLVFFVFSNFATAQFSEIGASVGLTNYVGDLSDGYSAGTFNLGSSLQFRRTLTPTFALRANLAYIPIEGTDADDYNRAVFLRNLSFRNRLLEFSGVAEWNISKLSWRSRAMSTPFIFAGFGVVYSNPKAQYNGEWVSLRTLGTEGQLLDNGKGMYSPLHLVFPVGGGVKMRMGNRIMVNLDGAYRFALTDYLDDVSNLYPNYSEMMATNPQAAQLSYRKQELEPAAIKDEFVGKRRGNVKTLDGYFYGGLSINYVLSPIKFKTKIASSF